MSTPENYSQTGRDAPMAGHAARGVSWLFVQSLCSKVAGVASNLVLGWLLMPEAFGLIGMAYSVSIFVALVSQAGLREILTQRHNRSTRWITPGFWLSVVTGLAGMLVMLGVSPIVAHVYGEPELVGLLAVLAVTTFLYSLAAAADAQLHAQLRFGFLGAFGVANTIGRVLMTIALAAIGFGAYSIVLPGLVFAAINAAVLWWNAPVRPAWSLQGRRWKYLIASSLFVFGATGLYTLMTQSGSIFLGVFSTTAAVGLFYFAFALALQPLMLLGHAVRRVLLPTLSRMNGQPARQAAALERASRLLMLLVIPMAWFQIPLAADFMDAVFPERWAPAVIVLQMLSLAIPLRVFGWTSGSALQAQGRFRTHFMLSVVAAVGSFAVAAVTAAVGPIWLVALGFSLFVGVLEPATYVVAVRRGAAEAMTPFIRPLFVGALGTGFCWLGAEAARSFVPGPWAPLIVGAATGSIAYAALVRLMLPESWRDLRSQAEGIAPARVRRLLARPVPAAAPQTTPTPATATNTTPLPAPSVMISVVIPTYNRSPDVVRAIESCLGQLGDYDEIVVVDDGSTDGTPEVLQRYVDRLPGIVRAVRQDNAGVGAARNTGFEHAAGDYVLLLDSDDVLLPWAIRRVREAIELFDSPAVVASQTAFFDDEGEIDRGPAPHPAADVFPDMLAAWRRPPYLPGSGVAIRRSALDRAGEMVTACQCGEDIDLYLRLAREPGFVFYLNPIHAQHRPRAARHRGLSQDPASVYRGAQHLLQRRAVGAYGPSSDRGRERDAWITATTRPCSLFLARHGLTREAMLLYRRTLAMNTSIGRWRYVLAFPALAAIGRLAPARPPAPPPRGTLANLPTVDRGARRAA